MKYVGTDEIQTMLCELIGRETVNPVGRPYDKSYPVERPVVEYLEAAFAGLDVELTRQSCSPIHESLVIKINGEQDGPPALFESHIDTVPADDWPDGAFNPRVEDGRVYGRGACDDCGSLAAMALAVIDLLKCGEKPPRPVYLMGAGDEEFGGTGITHFVKGLKEKLAFGVFGEPTGNVPVVQHKGTCRWSITTHGRSAHTANPELGRDAIKDMVKVLGCIYDYGEYVERLHRNPLMTGPRLTPTLIDGGRTRNAVADTCTVWIDYRIMPGLDGRKERKKLIDEIAKLPVSVTHTEPQIVMAPLSTAVDHPCAVRALAICGEVLGREVGPTGAAYASDASGMQPGAPAILLGPGDIAHAHTNAEWVGLDETLTCAEIYRRYLLEDWAAIGQTS